MGVEYSIIPLKNAYETKWALSLHLIKIVPININMNNWNLLDVATKLLKGWYRWRPLLGGVGVKSKNEMLPEVGGNYIIFLKIIQF